MNAEFMEIKIPALDEHNGMHIIKIKTKWTCLICGKPRGKPFLTDSYDGSRKMQVHGWINPCGHIEKYSLVRDNIEGNKHAQ